MAPASQQPVSEPARVFSRKYWPWWFGVLLVAGTFAAYWPALRGGFVWDDDSWTTGISGLLGDLAGLGSIWMQPTALQQYYPLTGTSFWVDYQLWGWWTTPYHVENVVLHLMGVYLFWRVLVRLGVPGAWVGAGLFALHPVMVESVGWVTERKNVLSLVLYLAAFWAYLGWAEASKVRSPKSKVLYVGALILFLGALLSKTTVFALPAVILLVAWWKQGRLRWREDVVPTLPFFVLSIGMSGVTGWLEKHHVGAEGSDFELSWEQRMLVAGRVPWFYVGKLLWPGQLCFVYERWEPDGGVWWQWVFPVGAVGILSVLWWLRGRLGRGPLAAGLYLVGTLFPLLGFLNAYGMRYSFVWDHWVYLPSLGVFALGGAVVVKVGERLRRRGVVNGLAVVVLAVLGVLTWRQAEQFRNMETLWQTTIERNPNCWMALSNLGSLRFDRGQAADAEALYRRALELNPDYAEARSNLGTALAAQGKFAAAYEEFERALQLNPNYAEGHYNLGVALAAQGRRDEAIPQFEQALQLKPNYADAVYNMGTILAAQGKLAEAVKDFNRVLQLQPNHVGAYFNLGTALAIQGRLDEAIEHFTRLLEIKPDYARAHFNLALALASQGKTTQAVQHLQLALALATTQGDAALAGAVRARLKNLPPAQAPPPQPKP